MKPEFPYYYSWMNNEKRIRIALRPCKIIAHGKMNSVEIEFKNGQREIVDRRGLRKIKNNHHTRPAEKRPIEKEDQLPPINNYIGILT